MRILVGKTFGIGNAVMAVPMVKALQSMPDTTVDILVGNTPDDVGAYQVLSKVVSGHGKIYVNTALEHNYDVAVMAIPFDGRWRNGLHFNAKDVMDGRTRPNPSTTGLVSWKYHESIYQMDNARILGFKGFEPSCSFMPRGKRDKDLIYLGLGYKKDAAGFWKVKHWGNENYAALITAIVEKYPEKKIVTTGDILDWKMSIKQIANLSNDKFHHYPPTGNLEESFKILSDCGTYVGNDTGMMHVAASLGLDVIAMFFLENSIVKSRPMSTRNSEDWQQKLIVIDGTQDRSLASVERVLLELERIYE